MTKEVSSNENPRNFVFMNKQSVSLDAHPNSVCSSCFHCDSEAIVVHFSQDQADLFSAFLIMLLSLDTELAPPVEVVDSEWCFFHQKYSPLFQPGKVQPVIFVPTGYSRFV